MKVIKMIGITYELMRCGFMKTSVLILNEHFFVLYYEEVLYY